MRIVLLIQYIVYIVCLFLVQKFVLNLCITIINCGLNYVTFEVGNRGWGDRGWAGVFFFTLAILLCAIFGIFVSYFGLVLSR